MKINEAKALINTSLNLAMEKGIYLANEFVSGPGMGKSEIVVQACMETANRLGKPVAYIPFFLSTVEPPDVRGFGVPAKQPDGSMHMVYTKAPWMPGNTATMVAEPSATKLRRLAVGEPAPSVGILHLDEFRQAQHDVQKPAAELFLNRRVGESQLPDGYIVVASSNRESDRSGVVRELAFITNRRAVINIEPNLDAWVNWAERKGVNPLAIAYAQANPGDVFSGKVPDKPGPFCTPRTLVKMSELIGELEMEAFTEVAAGLIGEGTAAKLVAFLRVVEQLPKFEDIVANPKHAKLPDRPDASYAVMQMISHRVDEKTARPAFDYLKRLGKEFQVAGLRSTFNRVPQMVRTPEFGAWLRDNKDLVIAANLQRM